MVPWERGNEKRELTESNASREKGRAVGNEKKTRRDTMINDDDHGEM